MRLLLSSLAGEVSDVVIAWQVTIAMKPAFVVPEPDVLDAELSRPVVQHVHVQTQQNPHIAVEVDVAVQKVEQIVGMNSVAHIVLIKK